MKAKTKATKSRGGSSKAKPKAKRKLKVKAKAKTRAQSKPSRAKPKPKARAKPVAKASTRAKAAARPKAARRRKPRRARAAVRPRWVAFVKQHGVVLASARGPVPSVAEAVAGEPIVGSWWAHPKGKAIFEALSELDDSLDVRSFKLVDGKVTFAHRNAWPALVRLGHDGLLAPDQLAALQQEHMPTGEHRNFVTPFPDWVDEATDAAAAQLTTDEARAQLTWADG